MGGKGGKELKLGNGMQSMSFFCLVKKDMINALSFYGSKMILDRPNNFD
jgi:hypothetical protein